MTDEWPSYHKGRADHLQALGVIALSFSAFQRSLHDLYAHHPQRQNVPYELTDLYYTSLNEKDQIKAIRAVFKAYDKEPETVALVNNLLDYFNWCWAARNQLLHAESYPSLFGGDPAKLYLIKRKSKKEAESVYQWHTVQELRDIADHIEHGKQHCAGIIIYLRIRDSPPEQLPLSYRALTDQFPLKPVAIPAPLTPSPHPEFGVTPDYIKKKPRL